jgi:outer membrane protein insertion porin family
MKRVSFIALVTAILLATSSGLSQQTDAREVYKILGISVEGTTLADPGAIIANSGLRVGDEFVLPGDQIGEAIRKLWSLSIFDDIQVVIEQKIGNGVYLAIRVRELPRYERTEIQGNDELDEEEIEKKVNLTKGQVLAPQELVRIKKEILKLYEAEGFLLAQIETTTEPVDTLRNRVVLKLEIDEGVEVGVASIMFEGNHAFDEGDLKGEMEETSEKKWWKFWSSANFDRKKYEEDKRLIVKYYRNSGYRDAEILSDSIWYSENKEDMFILLRIAEGPQYKIRNVVWEGNTVYADSVLNQRLNILPGEIYNAAKFEQNLRGNDSQTDVASLYLDNGYLTFNLEPKETRVGEDSVDIHINVYERNRFRIGHVAVKGNTKTMEKVIRRELHTRPGDYFSRAAIIRSVRELSVLNYFNPEKIRPDYSLRQDGETVDLAYEVEEKSSDNINASVGYSGAFGFTGALGFTLNNFSITDPLAGGAGQILNFEWQFGEASSFRTFTIGFTEPWLFDTPTLLGVSLFDTRQRITFDLRQVGGSLRVGRRFKWPDIYFRGDWILNAQSNDVIDGRGVYIEGKSSQVSLTQIITRNSIDNPVFPSSGSNVSLSVEVSGGPLLPGTIDFHKWNLQSDWYVPMFGTNRVALLMSSTFGYLSEFGSGSPIPPIELFFMGGTGLGYISTTQLRGYDDQSVGPRTPLGSIIGGRAMTKHTAELRFALTLDPIPIYVLSFLEGGNVYETFARADFFDLKRSAGLGARLQINPIGLIGFDYGYGFDDVFPLDGNPDGWRFHFVFGRGF